MAINLLLEESDIKTKLGKRNYKNLLLKLVSVDSGNHAQRGLRKPSFDGKKYKSRIYAKGGMTQGYNARMDESLGMRHRGSKMQSLKSRRDEAKGMNKAYG